LDYSAENILLGSHKFEFNPENVTILNLLRERLVKVYLIHTII